MKCSLNRNIQSSGKTFDEIEYLRQQVDILEKANNSLRREIVVHKQTETCHRIFREFADSASEALGMAEFDGQIVYANPSLCRILGLEKPEDAVGTYIPDYYLKEDRIKLEQEILPAVIEQGMKTIEMPLVSVNNQVTVTHQSIFLIRDNKGAPFCFASVITDITDRKQAEGKLRQARDELEIRVEERTQQLSWEIIQRKRLAAILESTSDLVSTATPDGEITFLNSAGRQMLGWKPEEDIGSKKISDAHPEWAFIVVDKLGIPAAVEKNIWEGETAIIGAGGREIPVSQVIMAHKSSSGEVEFLSTIMRDITDLRRAEKMTFDSKKRFQDLANLLPAAIYETDILGNVTYVNKNAFDYFGYTLHDLQQGINVFDLCVPEERSRAKANFQKILQGMECGLNEYTAVRKNGETFPVMLHSTAIGRHDKPIGLRGIVVDISEKKNMENQLIQSQKMEAVGRLAAGVAHDFNNILTAIIGYSELAKVRLSKEDPLLENIQIINESAIRASSLTRQLLAFSRKQVLNMIPVNLNELINNLAKMLVRMIGEDITFETHPKTIGYIRADPGQMEQVIMNLVVNARDAMPDGGHFIIEISEQEIDDEETIEHQDMQTGTYVKMVVKDTGYGMTQELMEKIFDPFFTTKESGQGTGLGLATVYGIIKQHGGFISVDSLIGRGTSFTIYLPVYKGRRPEEQKAVFYDFPGGDETILLVEDEPNVRKLIIDILDPLGYMVLSTANGDEALGIGHHHEGRIDLLITDVVMPGMNGRELAEQLLEWRPEMKAIFMSGYTNNALRHNGVLEPGFIFMQKPISPVKLATTIRSVLEDNVKSQGIS